MFVQRWDLELLESTGVPCTVLPATPVPHVCPDKWTLSVWPLPHPQSQGRVGRGPSLTTDELAL